MQTQIPDSKEYESRKILYVCISSMQLLGTKRRTLRDNSGFCAFTVEYKSSYFKKIQFKTI